MRRNRRAILEALPLAAAVAASLALSANAQGMPPLGPGWHLERGVDQPSYAMAAVASPDLDIDLAVVSCEQGPDRRGLQLSLFQSRPGPLAPYGAGDLKDDPAIDLVIDGVSHPAHLLFADDFVVVADSADGAIPLLSDALVAALEDGHRLELRFDLVREPPGQPAAFDASAAVDLHAGTALAAVRRCAESADRPVETAEGGH